MDAYVEVIRPDGSSERHRIEGEQVTVGRSPSAGVTVLGADELDAEHVLIAPRTEGAWVAVAKGARTAVKMQGKAFDHGLVPWGTEFEIGELKLRVSDALSPTKAPSKDLTTPLLLSALVVVPAVLWIFFSDTESALPSMPNVPAPELFSDEGACPAGGEGARVQAQESSEAAAAKAERYPFDPQDGVESVGLFASARACWQAAGLAAEAAKAQQEGAAMERRIDEDFLTHRLRLEQALKNDRARDALVEARSIKAIVRHVEGPYRDWIVRLERVLQMRVDQQGSR